MSAIAEASSELVALAFRIADSTCRSDIECNTLALAGHWYDTRDPDGENASWLPDCLAYLDARGMVEHAAPFPHLIRFKPPQ